MKSTLFRNGIVAGLVLVLAACGTDSPQDATDRAADRAPSVELTGEVIEVRMISDLSRGELFEPADITVNRGDVVRFVLVTGVHNANFETAEGNPAGVELPEATPYLQLPGQTFDLVVEQPAGVYHFQCDPHVALGMIGTMTVR